MFWLQNNKKLCTYPFRMYQTTTFNHEKTYIKALWGQTWPKNQPQHTANFSIIVQKTNLWKFVSLKGLSDENHVKKYQPASHNRLRSCSFRQLFYFQFGEPLALFRNLADWFAHEQLLLQINRRTSIKICLHISRTVLSIKKKFTKKSQQQRNLHFYSYCCYLMMRNFQAFIFILNCQAISEANL